VCVTRSVCVRVRVRVRARASARSTSSSRGCTHYTHTHALAGGVIPPLSPHVFTLFHTHTQPPALGYGAAGAGGVIPGGATLIFTTELMSIA
jgi:hypothetical protein